MAHQHATPETGWYGSPTEQPARQAPGGGQQIPASGQQGGGQQTQGGGQQAQGGGQQAQGGGQQPQVGGQQVQGSQPVGGIGAGSGAPAGQSQIGGPRPGGETPGQGTQPPVAQAGGGTQAAIQRGPGLTVDDALSGATRVALHDAIEAKRVCEWCADQCIDVGPEMARCIRLCRDVVGLAELTIEFLIRDSIFGTDVARTFAEAAEECARECSQHPHEHCQECADVLPRAAQTVRELVATVGAQPLPAGGQ